MVLATAAGFVLERFAQIPSAFVLGLVVGLIAAQLIPSKGACSLPRRPEPSDPRGDT